MTTSRHERAFAIAQKFEQLPGVESVTIADYDDTWVDIYIELGVDRYLKDHSDSWAAIVFRAPILSTKNSIRRVLRARGVDFDFLHTPLTRYATTTVLGRASKHDNGYDSTHIKLGIAV